MILPPIRILQKQKQMELQNKKKIRLSYKTPNKIYENSLGKRYYPNSFTVNQEIKDQNYRYQGYSKIKSLITTSNNSNYSKLTKNIILIPEYSVTPGYLESIKSIWTEPRDNILSLKPKIKIFNISDQKHYAIKKKLPENLLSNSLTSQSRKIILSKTPDPWKRHISKNEFNYSSESDEDYIGNNY